MPSRTDEWRPSSSGLDTDPWKSDVWEPGLSLRRGRDVRVLIITLVMALLTDAAVRSGVATLGGFILVVAVAGGLLISGRIEHPQARGLVAVAPLFGFWLTVHTSMWLVPLDIIAVGGLVLLAASLESGGSLFDISLPSAIARGLHALAHGVAAPAFVARSLRTSATAPTRVTMTAVLQGIGLAMPILVVIGVLLGTADAVFASFFQWWTPESVVLHGVLVVTGAWGMAGLLRLASAEAVKPFRSFGYRLGTVQASVVLGSLVTLFGAFAVAQLIAISDGGHHVIETSGLSYAEYARSGFFQLLAVATITLAVLLVLRAVTDLSDPRSSRVFLVLSEAAVALTLLVVFVAVRRLSLYEDAFGLTMLRLYSQVFAVWVGVVFLFLGAALAGVERHRVWLPPAAAAAGLAMLFTLNVINPEVIVVDHNVEHATSTGQFDAGYLAGLSDDAVPALVDAIPQLDPAGRQKVLELVCTTGGRSDDRSRHDDGWLSTNLSSNAARDARSRVCPIAPG
ncbi:MAG TPA: DUF4173 domain-containing protein [Acidimicrobiales bacterium]|nr:DUF4173 domain-containing protein [Acidimicrobiales bacterium]